MSIADVISETRRRPKGKKGKLEGSSNTVWLRIARA